MSTLIIAEHDNQTMAASLACVVTAASQLNQDVHVLVAGQNCQGVAKQAASLLGVTKVLLCEAPHLEHQLAEELSLLVVGIADQYETVMAAASTTGKNLLPRVGALLDVQPISDVISVEFPCTFKRPIYAGNVIATVESTDNKRVVTVRATAFDAVLSGGGAAIESITAPPACGLSKFLAEELAKSDRPELTSAAVVVSGGRGLLSSDNFNLLYQLADKLGAAVGASRAAVDAGFVPNDMQVGQTGKIVAPDLYMAFGISGAIQHLAGMKESKVIVAVNTDEDAPIFQIADYGLVADLFTILPELTAKLS